MLYSYHPFYLSIKSNCNQHAILRFPVTLVINLCICYFEGNKFGNRLLYVAIAFNTTLNPITLGYRDGLPIHDNWEEFIQNEVSYFNIKLSEFKLQYGWHHQKAANVRLYSLRKRIRQEDSTFRVRALVEGTRNDESWVMRGTFAAF